MRERRRESFSKLHSYSTLRLSNCRTKMDSALIRVGTALPMWKSWPLLKMSVVSSSTQNPSLEWGRLDRSGSSSRTGLMADSVLDYWEGSEPSSGSFCPEAALFRFLNSLGARIQGLRVLEVGCGANRGVSLSECRRRGAEAFGTDLSEDLLNSARTADSELHLSRSRAGVEPLPFGKVAFDVIFVIDVLYYLSDEEIRSFFMDVRERLTEEGVLVVQFIEADISGLEIDASSLGIDVNVESMTVGSIAESANPIRWLSERDLLGVAKECGLVAAGRKLHIESYDLDGIDLRFRRFLAFRRAAA